MPKKVVKKVAVKAKNVAVKSSDSSQMVIAAIVVVSTVLVAPAVWFLTKSLLVLFLIPTAVSFVAAAMFKEVTGKVMTTQFRNETTTITAVFAVVLSVLTSLNLPNIELDGTSGNTLPIFMIIYMSVWAIVGVLVTVYLPLGMTVEKKK